MSFIPDEKEIQSFKQEIAEFKDDKAVQPSLSNRIVGFVFGVFASFFIAVGAACIQVCNVYNVHLLTFL